MISNVLENEFRVTRGKYYTVFANLTLFLNEGEESRITFPPKYGFNDFILVFIKTDPPMRNPEISIHPTSERTRIEFRGWNAPMAYSAYEPINIGSNEENLLDISLATMYIGQTYKVEIQFYLQDRQEYIKRNAAE